MRKRLIHILKSLKSLLKRKFNNPSSKWPYIITALFATIAVIFGIILFVKFTHRMMSDVLASYDERIFDFIWSFRSPELTQYFVAVTEIGDVIGYAIVFSILIITFLIIFKNWRYILQLGLVLVLALSSNVLLKQIINRARPDNDHLVSVKTLSYPSGHAMMSMAFYGFLIYLIVQFKLHKTTKGILISLMVWLILSIGVSRIYLGVHYPSDILGGYLGGLIWVVFCILIFNLLRIFRRDPET